MFGGLDCVTDFSGRMRVFEAKHTGTLSQISVQVPHVFRKFPCSSHKELPTARLQYFIENVCNRFISCGFIFFLQKNSYSVVEFIIRSAANNDCYK